MTEIIHIFGFNGKAVGGNKTLAEVYITSCDKAVAEMLDAKSPIPVNHKKGQKKSTLPERVPR